MLIGEENKRKCETCGSDVQRRYESEMYAGSYVLNSERLDIRKRPKDGPRDPIVLDKWVQYFNGKVYRLYQNERYFYSSSYLHRDVWTDAYGPIPDLCHIHHIDNDPANNKLDNLVCLPKEEHAKIAKSFNPGFSENCRKAANSWHGSEAGKIWHKEQATRCKSWEKWKREPKACSYCGKSFEALVRNGKSEQRFCHANCKAAEGRRRRKAERT